jgi:hypothetical protein
LQHFIHVNASISVRNGLLLNGWPHALLLPMSSSRRGKDEADNPAQIVDRQLKRDAVAVGTAVGLGHGPTAGRNCFGANVGDCLGAACIPDFEEHNWLSGDV